MVIQDVCCRQCELCLLWGVVSQLCGDCGQQFSVSITVITYLRRCAHQEAVQPSTKQNSFIGWCTDRKMNGSDSEWSSVTKNKDEFFFTFCDPFNLNWSLTLTLRFCLRFCCSVTFNTVEPLTHIDTLKKGTTDWMLILSYRSSWCWVWIFHPKVSAMSDADKRWSSCKGWFKGEENQQEGLQVWLCQYILQLQSHWKSLIIGDVSKLYKGQFNGFSIST